MDVTNNMLYELLKDFRSDVDRRFDLVDKRFEQVDKRFEHIEDDIKDIREDLRDVKQDIRVLQKDMRDIHQNRDKVTVAFTRSWALSSFLIAITSSGLVLLVAAAI